MTGEGVVARVDLRGVVELDDQGALELVPVRKRLMDPGANLPLASMINLALPLICLGPVWWLSRRAPDLQTAK